MHVDTAGGRSGTLGAPPRTRKIVGRKGSAEVRVRFTVITIRAASADAGDVGTGLAEIVVPPTSMAKASDARERLRAISVAAASQ